MVFQSRVALILLALITLRSVKCGYAGNAGSTSSSSALKTLAEQKGTRLGAYYQYDLRSTAYDKIFETEFGIIVAGTFWTDGSRPSRNEYDLTEMDAKVDWGRARSMEVHGHTLVWFEDIPTWLKETANADVETVMNEHIDKLVGRYAGKIAIWDVVNEVVDKDGTLRKGHKWVEAMGDDYIRKAFVRANAADPNAILRISDYDIETTTESGTAKFNRIKSLLTDLKNAGVPVHALGWQLHLSPTSLDTSVLLSRMNEIADLGIDNYITELDVELPAHATTADYEQQKQTFKKAIQTFLSARRHKTIVVWGLHDGDPHWLTSAHPLLFDSSLNKKSAYDGVKEAFQGQ